MKKILIAFLSVAALFQSAVAQQKSSMQNPLVKIANGTLEGKREQSGVVSFKGIPFAAPPVGDLRWKEPQPAHNWQGIYKAHQFGPRAMQPPIFGDMNFRSNGMSEDCLYLNVWAPERKGKELFPVLVYFYGGGFVAGDGSEPRYDGESMAQHGIVALTVNYRLGIFGFLTHPELTKESPNRSSGNYGLLDQAAALRWVQQNIAAFGGDPKRVTIAGESAGSISVSAQMASPLSKNLIAGAIGESGSLLGTLSAVPLHEAEKIGVEFAEKTGARSIQALRNMPADSLLKAYVEAGAFRFPRTIDGYFFPKNPYEIYEKGEQAKVPLLVGWNSEESGPQAILGREAPTKENFEKAVRRIYGQQADDILKLYNPATDAEVERTAAELAGNNFIGYSTWKWSDLHSQTSGKAVYRYYYERPRPAMTAEYAGSTPGLAGGVQKGTGTGNAPRSKGAVHSAEIEYAMGNLATNKVYAWTEDDYKVSRIMQAYFANFIKMGDPNGPGLPSWPATSSTKPVPVLHIDVNTRVEPEKHRDRFLYIDQNTKR